MKTESHHSPVGPLEIFDPRTYASRVPYDLFAQMRSETPVAWIDEPAILGWPEGPGYWAVFCHAHVKAVLRDWATFSSQVGATQISDYTPEDLAYVQRQLLNMDPPDHTRIRRLVGRSFTPKAIAHLEERIEGRAKSLAAAVAGRQSFDFIDDFSADLPLFALAELLGVPESDRYLLYDWANRVIGYQDEDYATSSKFNPATGTPLASVAVALRPSPGPDGRLPNPRSRAGMPDLYGYAHELSHYKRRHPGEDIMSILLHAKDDEGSVSNEEFENLFWLFAVAGNETLRNGLSGGMAALLSHPNQYRRLRKYPELLPTAIEEMLRWWPPVIHFRRTAVRSTELGGVEISTGDKVVVYHASANRDETVFDKPDMFLIDRKPNDHLSFGSGAHLCLGAYLARVQSRSLFTEVLTTLPELELDGPPVRLTSNFQNGLKHLPVRTT